MDADGEGCEVGRKRTNVFERGGKENEKHFCRGW